MESTIVFEYTPEFLKSAKVLSKLYRSFADDLKYLCKEIAGNPQIGDDLAIAYEKIRMAIKAKGKGKSGGARVISLSLVLSETQSKMTFLYVYDKSDMANISDNKIRQIIADNNLTIS